MKRLTALLIVLLLLCLPVSAVVDPADKVHDEAGLFTAAQQAELRDRAQKLVEAHSIDAVILTIDDDGGKSTRNYAADFYDYNGFGTGGEADGVLLLINMDAREVFMLTTGSAIQTFTDRDIDRIIDGVYDYLADGDYYGGAQSFLQSVDRHLRSNSPSARRMALLGKCFLGSLAVAAIVVAVMYFSHKGSLPKAPSYHAYLGGERIQLRREHDRFVSTHTARVPIPKQTSGGGGGGSSTFTGSSGRSHGGGGRKF